MRLAVTSIPLKRIALAVIVYVTLAHCAVAAKSALHIRSGLPHVASEPAQLRVAYLGGSITAASDGWRTLTTQRLRSRLSNTNISEISAGLPGTGSDLGACRIQRDVLRHHPDLLFVEFAVNDTNTPVDRIERTMEGIVRQTWRANPNTDIVFVYTVSTPGLPDLHAGRFPPAAQAMERVAEHYEIPSIHFGIEVARRVTNGEIDFKNPAAPDDPRTFSLDGVHPSSSGHRIYAETLERALGDILAESKSRPAIPAPLHTDNWEGAQLRELSRADLQGEWTRVPSDDPNLRGATKPLLPPTWRTESPGSSVELEFTGTVFGLLGIAAPDSGKFRVTIDDYDPITATFFDAFVSPTFCRQRPWFYPAELKRGRHRVRVELLGTQLDKAAIKATRSAILPADAARYEPHRLALSGVLIVGDSAP